MMIKTKKKTIKERQRERETFREDLRLRGLKGERRRNTSVLLHEFIPASQKQAAKKSADFVFSNESGNEPEAANKQPQQDPNVEPKTPAQATEATTKDVKNRKHLLLETQFGDMGSLGKSLTYSTWNSFSGEDIKELLEHHVLAKNSAFTQPQVNYAVHETRKNIVTFQTPTGSEPDEVFQNLVQQLRLKRDPKSRKEEGHSTATAIEPSEDGQDREEDTRAETPNASQLQSTAFSRLEMRLDKVIGRLQNDETKKNESRKLIWSGWTVQRIVERKRNIAALLEAKAKRLESENAVQDKQSSSALKSDQQKEDTSEGSKELHPNQEEGSKSPFATWKTKMSNVSPRGRLSSMRQSRTSNVDIQTLREAVEKARIAAAKAELEARGHFDAVFVDQHSKRDGGKFLRRVSKSVRLVSRLPEKVREIARQEEKAMNKTSERKASLRRPPAQGKSPSMATHTKRIMSSMHGREKKTATQKWREEMRKKRLAGIGFVSEADIESYLSGEGKECISGEEFQHGVFQPCGDHEWLNCALDTRARRKVPTRPESARVPQKPSPSTRRIRPSTARHERDADMLEERFTTEPKFSNYLRTKKRPASCEEEAPQNLDHTSPQSQKPDLDSMNEVVNRKVDEHMNFILRYISEPCNSINSSYILFPR